MGSPSLFLFLMGALYLVPVVVVLLVLWRLFQFLGVMTALKQEELSRLRRKPLHGAGSTSSEVEI